MEHIDLEALQKQLVYQAEPHDVRSQSSLFTWSGGYNPLEFSERQYERLAKLQHWGGETNLIDFTTDYYVALFFACEPPHDGDGRIIILDRVSAPGETWRPTEPRHRVEAQKSVFIRPPDGFIHPNPEKVICIPRALKLPILKHLARQSPSITTETMYNDLHGFIKMQKRYRNVFAKFYIAVSYEKQGDKAETLSRSRQAFENAIR